MDELTLSHELNQFRDFRSDTPGPSAAETKAARGRLLDAMAADASAASRPARRWALRGRFGRTRVWAPVAAAAAVTAIAITVALLAAPGSSPKPSPTATHHPAHPRHQKSHSRHGASKNSTRRGQGGASAGSASSGAPGTARSGGSGAAGTPGPTSFGPPTPTTTILTASPEATFTAHQVRLTATVSDQAGDNLSGGTVGFWLFAQAAPGSVAPTGAIPVCQSAPLTYQAAARDNIATCDFTPGDGYSGSYVVGAGYHGYRQYQLSDSAEVPLTITTLTTVTTLTSVSPAQASPGRR